MSNLLTRLINSGDIVLSRGDLIRFPTQYPFENEVIMMVAESPRTSGLCLITITGYKAGINCFQELPKSEIDFQISVQWLIENWSKWIYIDCSINDVFFRKILTPDELGRLPK